LAIILFWLSYLQAAGETEVLVAGDPERKHMELCDKQGGIKYHPNVITLLVSMFLYLVLNLLTGHILYMSNRTMKVE